MPKMMRTQQQTNRMQADRIELADRIARALAHDGKLEPQPGVHLHRRSVRGERVHAVAEPSFCVIAQGSKQIMLGDATFHYDPAHYLISTMELPLIGEIVEASPREPYLSFRLVLDPSLVTSVMVESAVAQLRGDGGGVNAVDVSTLDANLLDATLRLVRLFDSPSEYRVLPQ